MPQQTPSVPRKSPRSQPLQKRVSVYLSPCGKVQRPMSLGGCGKILLNVLGDFGAPAPDVSHLAVLDRATARALDHPILERDIHGRIFRPRGYASTPASAKRWQVS